MSRVGFNSAAGATVSVPAHSNGDVLVCFAMNAGGTTIPTAPSGFTNIAGNSTSRGVRASWRTSDGTITSITATNATGVGVWVFTSVDSPAIGTGFGAWSAWSGRTVLAIPSVTLDDSDGSSSRLSAAMIQATGLTFASAQGQTERGKFEDGGYTYAFFDRDSVTTAPTDNATITPGGTYDLRAFSIEVRLAPSGGSKFRAYYATH